MLSFFKRFLRFFLFDWTLCVLVHISNVRFSFFFKQVQCELKYKNGGQCNALYGHRLSLTLTPVTLAWIRLHRLH